MRKRRTPLAARRWVTASLALVVAVLGLIIPAGPAAAVDYTEQLGPNRTLYSGESIWSPDRRVRLTQQQDGNLVLYAMPGNKPLWSSGTRTRESVTQMQGDGNVVIR